ncbi:hypothetical protein TVAG_463770 [Trichomonas vaginalis G3]|uniref:Uncharacterized protein n=1 Tax=Trichomonas vaginalis (strain ATCC PRA-98 / G3) TaxID=412133 RepID=A2E230_TRIV3|nr:hypothetical protein TVAGG3_1049080 [Trichomonas vaginalis G3]EAY13244.1 hypothetical protein TVAG_463770 [Trichomonas vaginalis G3]KAI5494097.1 hypothetical protein TVAGG3_1049080 [Trichomonas vaginalis G3]|eukprot:XP_001325467.1 hypothetical protein [Trichomonas vaginalis G3]
MSLPSNWSHQLASITKAPLPLPQKKTNSKTSRTTGSIDPIDKESIPVEGGAAAPKQIPHLSKIPRPQGKGIARSSSACQARTSFRNTAKNILSAQAAQRAFENYTTKQTNLARKILNDEAKFERRQRTHSQIITSPVRLQDAQFQDNFVTEEVYNNAKKSNNNVPILPKSKLPSELSLKDADGGRVYYWG